MIEVLVLAACFLGSALGNAIRPLVKHADEHRGLRRMLRRRPEGTAMCRSCGKEFYGTELHRRLFEPAELIP